MIHPRYLAQALVVAGALTTAAGSFAAEQSQPRVAQAMRGSGSDGAADATADKVLKNLSQTKWVLDGKPDAPRIIYVFTDPNCPYCHDFWEAARPWVVSGKVQIRALLVGVISEDSPNKAAAILGAPDPSKALTRHETAFSRGGIHPVDTISPGIRQQLEENQSLMLSLGFRGTPGIVIAGADGKPTMANGLPRDGKLETLFGPR